MYFPYIRGRQYELLALREMVEKNLLSSQIIPIIEPVKISSTLIKTLETFIQSRKKLAIIWNPSVGSFLEDVMAYKEDEVFVKKINSLLKNSYIIRSFIMSKPKVSVLEKYLKKYGETSIVINDDRDSIEDYIRIFSENSPYYVFIPSDFRRKIKGNRVLFEDHFKKCDRNSDYNEAVDNFFSEDHLFYKEDGYKGFADYSIIGKSYVESGFAPYAVAIHIVYFDKEKNLRIHHFVSDSNTDFQDPAKKFYEAVGKLCNWCLENEIEKTTGLETLKELYKNEIYPGLGSVKKLSLMHHLELMGKYLDKVNAQ